MSAMLSHPLTPPYESTSSNSAEFDLNGVAGAAGSGQPSSPQFATPVSNVNMGLDERPDSRDTSDEDQEMSDGGAPLTMTLSHAEQINAEMDILDVEIMGQDNLNELLLENHLPATLEEALPNNGSSSGQGEPSPGPLNDPNHALNEIYIQGMGASIPNTMSAVSLQLQYLQEQHIQEEYHLAEQEHADLVEEAEDHNPTLISTSSIPLPSFLAVGAEAGVMTAPQAGPQSVNMSLVEIVTSSNSQVSVGASNSLQAWSTEDSTPSSALSVVAPLPSQQFIFLEPSGELMAHAQAGPPSFPNEGGPDLDFLMDADGDEVHDSRNHNLVEFLYHWNQLFARNEDSRRRPKGPAIPVLVRHRSEKLAPMYRSDLRGDECDIQHIDWTELGVSRVEARQMRRHTYRNYVSTPQRPVFHPRQNGARLDDDQNFFRFRKMDFNHHVHLAHFQLRNLLACASRDHIFYAAQNKVLHCSPQSNKISTRASVAIDLTEPIVQPFHSVASGVHITTLTVGHDILVAGGYDGEYSLMNLKASKHTKHTEGLITDNPNSITNHVQVHLSRGSSLPVATFASNDSGVRVLDISTNKCIAEHNYDHAINCTAISPDQRLRVLVGDTRQVMICRADTGEVLQSLEGHRDYGFACDWADDGWTVASGNQDMQVKIWDARKWTNSSGIAQPIATIAADMAGVRKLKFSPLGSGKRVLIAAEPADIVSVIDGERFMGKQTLSFFGEIGGVDFTNDGQDLIVANCDPMRGGLMEFERCDLASGGVYNLEEYQESRIRRSHRGHRGYDWMDGDDDDLIVHPKARGTVEQRRRKPAGLGINMGYF